MSSHPQIHSASDHSILIQFGEEISIDHHRNVRRLFTLISKQHFLFVQNIQPAYTSLLITFNPLLISFDELKATIARSLEKLEEVTLPQNRILEIPVRYGGEFGPDVEDVATHTKLSPEDVYQKHSDGNYLVYFVGFSPGFAYMGGLREELSTPRLSTPRTKVPPGSVAIGGKQTGIYPLSTPGGWRIIGRTPLRLFDPSREHPSLLQIGDVVKFVSINDDEFKKLL